MTRFREITVTGIARFPGGMEPPLARASLRQDSFQAYNIPWTAWREWNDMSALLTDTAHDTNLELVDVWGVHASIQTGDLKAAGSTLRYARTHIALPIEYVAGQTVAFRFHAGMKTTISDGTAALALEVYKSDEEEGWDANLVTGAAPSINSLTLVDKDFILTSSSLNPGDLLNVRVAMLINDTASGDPVIGIIGAAKLLCDVKG